MATTFPTTEVHDEGFRPPPLSCRVFVRCYRHYGDAKRAYDQLRVVAGIPEPRMSVVARGLDWREPLPPGRLYKLTCGFGALIGAAVGVLLWLVGLTSADSGIVLQAVFGAIAGVVIGFALGTTVAWLRADRTGHAETGHVHPRQYDILVEEELAPAARDVLGED
ncbi:MAG TPA: hypothetical protein VFG79_02520 [Solirubrobacter sp.]|nr:hypothetical protein [Solirubrobacter sp.]